MREANHNVGQLDLTTNLSFGVIKTVSPGSEDKYKRAASMSSPSTAVGNKRGEVDQSWKKEYQDADIGIVLINQE